MQRSLISIDQSDIQAIKFSYGGLNRFKGALKGLFDEVAGVVARMSNFAL